MVLNIGLFLQLGKAWKFTFDTDPYWQPMRYKYTATLHSVTGKLLQYALDQLVTLVHIEIERTKLHSDKKHILPQINNFICFVFSKKDSDLNFLINSSHVTVC